MTRMSSGHDQHTGVTNCCLGMAGRGEWRSRHWEEGRPPSPPQACEAVFLIPSSAWVGEPAHAWSTSQGTHILGKGCLWEATLLGLSGLVFPTGSRREKSYWPNYSEVSEHPENLALPGT